MHVNVWVNKIIGFVERTSKKAVGKRGEKCVLPVDFDGEMVCAPVRDHTRRRNVWGAWKSGFSAGWAKAQ